MNPRLPSSISMLDDKHANKRVKYSGVAQGNYQEKLDMSQMSNFLGAYGQVGGEILLSLNDDISFENKKSLQQIYESNFNLSGIGSVGGVGDIGSAGGMGGIGNMSGYGEHIAQFNQFNLGNGQFQLPTSSQQRILEEPSYFRIPFDQNSPEASPAFYNTSGAGSIGNRPSESLAHNQNQGQVHSQTQTQNQAQVQAQAQTQSQTQGYRNQNLDRANSNQIHRAKHSRSRVNDHGHGHDDGHGYRHGSIGNNDQMHYLNEQSNFSLDAQFGQHGIQLMSLMDSDTNSIGQKATMSLIEKKQRRRESHNAVERRRRDNINERIQELYTLLPASMKDPAIKPNKGLILNLTVEYLKKIQAGMDPLLPHKPCYSSGSNTNQNQDLNMNTSSGVKNNNAQKKQCSPGNNGILNQLGKELSNIGSGSTSRSSSGNGN